MHGIGDAWRCVVLLHAPWPVVGGCIWHFVAGCGDPGLFPYRPLGHRKQTGHARWFTPLPRRTPSTFAPVEKLRWLPFAVRSASVDLKSPHDEDSGAAHLELRLEGVFWPMQQ